MRYGSLSEAVANEGRPPWQSHPPTQSGNKQRWREVTHNPSPPVESDHFLLKQHITQTHLLRHSLYFLIIVYFTPHSEK